MALELGRHAASCLVRFVLGPGTPVTALDSKLPWVELVRQASEHIPVTFEQNHVARAIDFFEALPMPELVEWNRLQKRLELEAELLDQEQRNPLAEGKQEQGVEATPDRLDELERTVKRILESEAEMAKDRPNDSRSESAKAEPVTLTENEKSDELAEPTTPTSESERQGADEVGGDKQAELVKPTGEPSEAAEMASSKPDAMGSTETPAAEIPPSHSSNAMTPGRPPDNLASSVRDDNQLDTADEHPTDDDAEPGRFLTAELLDLTGLGNTAFNKYVELANVPKTPRGKRNRRFSVSEARAILEAIVQHSSNNRDKTKAQRALENLSEITT